MKIKCPFCGGMTEKTESKDVFFLEKLLCFFGFLQEAGPEITGKRIEAFARSWTPERGVWVPVSEAMPNDGERVLVFHDDYVVRIGMAENGEFRPVTNKELKVTPVTHWKPLPLGPIGFLKYNGSDSEDTERGNNGFGSTGR